MQPQIEHMIQKLNHLTPSRLAEVEDFIDFIQQRDQDKLLRQCVSQASEDSLNKVWDNDDDAIYDSLINTETSF